MGWSGWAWADMDTTQVKVAAKVFNFILHKPPPGASIIVVKGAADLDLVKSVLGGMRIAQGTATDVDGAYAVFVTSIADAVSAKGINPGILTISGDLKCVEAGVCVVAIETNPKLAIYYSHTAATAAGIDFDTSFKLMVSER